MKQALTVGCGTGNGKTIIDTLLQKGYTVTNIGNSEHDQVNNIKVSWSSLQISDVAKLFDIEGNLDFVFFNQNASSLDSDCFDFSNTEMLEAWRLIKNWQHSYWISCQLPFLLIHKVKQNLNNQSKIGWMLSSTMIWNRNDVEKYPDYSSQKYFNYLSMKCFSKHYQTFGIMPNFSQTNAAQQISKIINTVCDQDVNNTIFNFQKSTE